MGKGRMPCVEGTYMSYLVTSPMGEQCLSLHDVTALPPSYFPDMEPLSIPY